MLKKYVPDPLHVIKAQSIVVQEYLSHEEKPIEILDWRIKTLRNKEIALVKVL